MSSSLFAICSTQTCFLKKGTQFRAFFKVSHIIKLRESVYDVTNMIILVLLLYSKSSSTCKKKLARRFRGTTMYTTYVGTY